MNQKRYIYWTCSLFTMRKDSQSLDRPLPSLLLLCSWVAKLVLSFSFSFSFYFIIISVSFSFHWIVTQFVCSSFDFEAAIHLLGLKIEWSFNSSSLDLDVLNIFKVRLRNHCIKGKVIQIENLMTSDSLLGESVPWRFHSQTASGFVDIHL